MTQVTDHLILAKDENTRPPLTTRQLCNFEHKHKIRFPKSFRNLLLQMNGGEFTYPLFRLRNEIQCINGVFGIDPKGYYTSVIHSASTTTWKHEKYDEWRFLLPANTDPKKIIIIFERTTGDDFLAMDFNHSPDNPSIWRLAEDEMPIRFAKTWDDFIASAYFGEPQPWIDLDVGWNGFKMLIDESNQPDKKRIKYPIRRWRLGLKKEQVKIQTEIVYNPRKERFTLSFIESEVSRIEYQFKLQDAIRDQVWLEMVGALKMRDLGLTSDSWFELHLRAMKPKEARSSDLQKGKWFNSEGAKIPSLITRSVTKACSTFKKLYGKG